MGMTGAKRLRMNGVNLSIPNCQADNNIAWERRQPAPIAGAALANLGG